MNILEGDLKKILSEKQTTEVRVKHLNTVKIFIYLIVEFSSFLEKKQAKDKDSDLMSGSKVNKQFVFLDYLFIKKEFFLFSFGRKAAQRKQPKRIRA